MTKNNKFVKVFFLLIFFSFSVFLSACVPNLGGGAKAPEKGEFVKGAVVKGFPSNLPLYDKAVAVESFGSTEEFGASFVSDADLADVVKFYNTALPQLGWQANLSQKSETNYVFDIKNDVYSGSVIVNVASDNEKTAITMYVVNR